MNCKNSDARGFTLIEATVALVILSISLTAILGSFGVGISTATSANRDREAIEVAANVIAELGNTRPVQEGWTHGDTTEGRHWRLRLTPVGPVDDHDPSPISTFAVDLFVQSGPRNFERHFQTLVLKPAL